MNLTLKGICKGIKNRMRRDTGEHIGYFVGVASEISGGYSGQEVITDVYFSLDADRKANLSEMFNNRVGQEVTVPVFQKVRAFNRRSGEAGYQQDWFLATSIDDGRPIEN